MNLYPEDEKDLYEKIDVPRLINFILKSKNGDSYTYGEYKICVKNSQYKNFWLECIFYDSCNGEYRDDIIIRLLKSSSTYKISYTSSSAFGDNYIYRVILQKLFSKDEYIPFDQEDIKEPSDG